MPVGLRECRGRARSSRHLLCWEEDSSPCLLQEGVKKVQLLIVAPGMAAEHWGEAAVTGLHLGTSARGTLSGAAPVDAAKLKPGKRVRIS